MTIIRLIAVTILISVFSVSLAQNFTISGYVKDSKSGEELIGANIFEKYALKGTATNTYGFYSITLPADTYTIVVSYVGYAPTVRKIDLKSNLQLDFELIPSIELEEVEISATQVQRIEEMTRMSTVTIPVQQIKELPALFGEVDVLKTIQLLPGVQSGTEGSSGFYVRGGGPDQNLILLDGTPVYNASHLFGFFSVFNADAIKNVELIKGGFPARYGGRLSSVLQIHMKEGNMKEFHGAGSLGVIASKLTLEGPIIKGQTSFIVSARRTYADYLAQPIIRLVEGDEYTSTGYFFYDLNVKVNHRISSRDRLYASLYMGDDKFYVKTKPYQYLFNGVIFEEESHSFLGWGNMTAALRWNHQINEKLFSNSTLTYSRYKFNVSDYQEKIEYNDTATISNIFSLDYLSGINDIAGKIDFDFLPNPDHYIKFGFSTIYHTFEPGATTYQITNTGVSDIDSFMGAKKVYGYEFGLYAEDDYKINDKLKANLGLHYAGFYVNGKYYHSLQPRVSARYLIGASWAAKASFASMQQNIHLLTNTSIGLPTDLWVPATDKVRPQTSYQVATGIAKTILDKFEFTVEGYYKWMYHLIEYKDGATFLSTETDWQDKVAEGRGWSYGGEVFIQKKAGNTRGWIGYTLSWTNRQFDDINFGEIYHYKYDRRHDISIVFIQKLDDLWDVSATWVYGTGNAITLPTVRYNPFYAPGDYIPQPGEQWRDDEIESFDKKNSFRMAAYHRFDISFRRVKEKKWGKSIWAIGAYNAYNRKNPFFYYFGYDSRGNRALRRVSIFPFLPSVSYQFEF